MTIAAMISYATAARSTKIAFPAAALIAAVAVALPSASSAREITSSQTVFALLANNELIAITAENGIVKSLKLGPPPRGPEVGHLLALAKDDSHIYATVQSDGRGRARIAVVDTASLTLTRSIAFPAGLAIRALAVAGPKLYAFANDEVTPGSEGAVVLAVDLQHANDVRRYDVRKPGQEDWRIYDGSVSPDGRHLLISYHSGTIAGADVLSLTQKGFTRCRPTWRTVPCLHIHGAAEFINNEEIVATTGDPPWLIVRRLDGTLVRRFSTGLTGDHLMEFVLSADRGTAYALGWCGYAGGLSITRLHPPFGPPIVFGRDPSSGGRAPTAICAERGALVDDTHLALAQTYWPVPAANRPGHIVYYDIASRAATATVTTPSEPVDVVAANATAASVPQ